MTNRYVITLELQADKLSDAAVIIELLRTDARNGMYPKVRGIELNAIVREEATDGITAQSD